MSIPDITPQFVNVTLVVVPKPDRSGNASYGQYDVTMANDVAVTGRNAVVNFQLVGETPEAIVFTGLESTPSASVAQLSPASVSLDGKMLTVSNKNSHHETIKLTFRFKDGEVPFAFDPQIENVPEHEHTDGPVTSPLATFAASE